MESVH